LFGRIEGRSAAWHDVPVVPCGCLALCLKVLTSGASIGTKQAMKRRKIQHVSGRAAAARPTVAVVATAARNWQSQ